MRVGSVSFECPNDGRLMFESFSLRLGRGGVCNLLNGGNANGDALLCLVDKLLHRRRNAVLISNVSTRRHGTRVLGSVFVIPRRFRLPGISLTACIGVGRRFCPGFSRRILSDYLGSFSLPLSLGLGRLSVKRGGGMFVDFTLTANAHFLLVSRPAGNLSVPSGDRFHGIVTGGVARSHALVVSARRIRSMRSLLSRVVVVGRDRLLLSTSISSVYRGCAFRCHGPRRVSSAILCTRPALRNGTTVYGQRRNRRRARVGLRLLFGTIVGKGLGSWGRVVVGGAFSFGEFGVMVH